MLTIMLLRCSVSSTYTPYMRSYITIIQHCFTTHSFYVTMHGQKDDLLQSFLSSQRTKKYTNETGQNAIKWLRRHLISVRKRALEGMRAGGRAPSHLTTYFYVDVAVCQQIFSWTYNLLELLKVCGGSGFINQDLYGIMAMRA